MKKSEINERYLASSLCSVIKMNCGYLKIIIIISVSRLGDYCFVLYKFDSDL